MSVLARGAMTRRHAVGAIAAVAIASQVPPQQRARAITQRGVVGGGLVQFEGGEAQFSLFASRTLFEDADDLIAGSILWVDSFSGLTFTTTDITAYEVVETPPEQGQVRRIHGTMRLDEGEEYPFVLEVVDAGLPGSRLDSVTFGVGDGVTPVDGGTPVAGLGFSYAAAGAVIGDIQIVDVEFAGVPAEAPGATPMP